MPKTSRSLSDAYDLTRDALAVWRLTNLLLKEDGPYDVFGRLRDSVGVRYDARNHPVAENEVAKAFTCFYCLSVWVALFMRFMPEPIRDILALSALALFMERKQ